MPKGRERLKRLAQIGAAYLGDLKSTSCTFNGRKWKYLDGGSGEVVLFLHGIANSKVLWRSLMHALSSDFRVISPDIPGLNLSVELSGAQANRGNTIKWLDAFCDALDIESVHLVGQGSGGGVASYYAHANPRRVKTLTWFSAPDFERLRTGNIPAWERLLVGFDTVDDVTEYLDNLYFSPPAYPNVIKYYLLRASKKTMSEGVFVDLVKREVAALPLLRSKLRGVAQPVLLISGDCDFMGSENWLEELSHMVPNGRFSIIERCGHFCFVERMDESVQLLKEFLHHSVRAG
ncbi:hypothetical protein A9Q99_27530 [Gammaproteobacteria bacterium 45_16_T64]|nr:hypothetical protein A9Q99_27530 [Gammaproteobacteria bacterium 45_16_T64]